MRSIWTRSFWTRGATWVVAVGLIGGWLGWAAPARAGDFEDGFEDQLGRIAAVSVVRFGAFVLQGAFQDHRGWRGAGAHGATYSPPPPSHDHPRHHAQPHHHHHGSHSHGHPGSYAPAPAHHQGGYAPPQPAAYPGPAPDLFAGPHGPEASDDDAPCEHTAAAPYGEHIVYERYERTVTGPPQSRSAPAPAPQHIRY